MVGEIRLGEMTCFPGVTGLVRASADAVSHVPKHATHRHIHMRFVSFPFSGRHEQVVVELARDCSRPNHCLYLVVHLIVCVVACLSGKLLDVFSRLLCGVLCGFCLKCMVA